MEEALGVTNVDTAKITAPQKFSNSEVWSNWEKMPVLRMISLKVW